MSGLFSGVIIKVLVLVVSLLVTGIMRVPETVLTGLKPITTVITAFSDEDTLDTDKEKKYRDERELREEARKLAEEARKLADEKRKQVQISITDKGIKVSSEVGDTVIVDFDMEEFGKMIEQLEDLPGVILPRFDEDEERRFVEVRGKDVVRFGESIYIDRSELVRGDVVSIFGDVIIEGKVMGDVVSILGDIDLGEDAIVNGEVVSVLGSLDREDGARVRGETAVIGGKDFDFPTICVGMPPMGRGIFGFFGRLAVFIIGLLMLGIVLAFLSDRMSRSSEYVFGNFFKSLGVGAVVFIAGSIVVALIAAILSITIIGIPVAILLVLSFAAICVLGYFVSALALGRYVAEKMKIETDSIYLQGFIGLFLLTVLSLLSGILLFNPFLHGLRMLVKTIAGFISMLALFVGIGAFINSKGGAVPRGAKPTLPE
jgi:hypothetical protein